MAKEAVKQEIIRIRVTTEQKELFKSAAAAKGVTLTEFIIVATNNRAKKEIDYIANKEIIEQRASITDAKLQILKEKLFRTRSL